jgi:glutathione S-transferase
VPILIHGDKVLAESDLISWYLAETFNTGTELIPKDTFDRAKLRHFIGETPGKVIGAFYSMMGYQKKTKEVQEAAIKQVDAALQLLENRIAGPYVLGEDFTLADILVYPWFERWSALESLLGIKIDEKYTKVHKWLKEVSSRKSVKEIAQDPKFYIDAFRER